MKTNHLDKIHIRDLLVRCIIGVNPDERIKEQDVVFNITLYADLGAACESDRLEDTVDYKAVKNKIIETAKASSCGLLENLAEKIAQVCLAPTPVQRADVMVDKPGALRFAKSVAIEITREKNESG